MKTKPHFCQTNPSQDAQLGMGLNRQNAAIFRLEKFAALCRAAATTKFAAWRVRV